MTSGQTKQYLVGVLSQWFLNKPIVDKFSTSQDDKLLWNNEPIGGGDEELTPQQIQQLADDTISDLNGE